MKVDFPAQLSLEKLVLKRTRRKMCGQQLSHDSLDNLVLFAISKNVQQRRLESMRALNLPLTKKMFRGKLW